MSRLADDPSVVQRIFDHIDNRSTDRGESSWREPVEHYRSEPRHRRELDQVNRDADRPGWTLVAIYHSHPNHGAYFSPTDKARALVPWESEPEPLYPGVAYVVLSVYDGALRDAKAYAWDGAARDFVEIGFEAESA